ncbi:centromere protein X [Anabrus simplex]|uniref:centromere protein X n=1 Tax=Anabrus simplex TaxID=316456 RepID=UPI0034DD8E18
MEEIVNSQTFKMENLKLALKQYFKDPKVRISNKIVPLIEIVLRTYLVEMMLRAGKEAKEENLNTIYMEHIEKILPLLMLDFS